MARTARDPDVAQAEALAAGGRLAEAEALAQRVLGAKRRNADALAVLGRVAFERAQYDLAARLYQEALGVDRTRAILHCHLARANMARGRHAEALAGFERALKLQPDHPEAIGGQADALERRGKRARAIAVLEPHVRAGRATSRMLNVYVRALVGERRDDEAVSAAEAALARPGLEDPYRRALLLLLGRARDRLGDADGAFEAFARGNAIGAPPYDAAAVAARVDAIIETFSAPALAALPRSTRDARLPVFVLGMPRCGSTLVEQILHAHPKAHGAGETHDLAHLLTLMPEALGTPEPFPRCARALTGDHADRLADSLLERLRTYAPRAERIVDKSLENHEAVGLIHLLWPGAALVHVRRHPLDVCLSCFMQDLPPRLHPYASDLRSLGLHYREYARLMSHWRSMDAIRMLEIDYERLVAHSEEESRRLVDFVGLDWDDRCLRFHEARRDVGTISYDQVRRPIYAEAVARYRRYEKHLGELREALGECMEERE